MFLKYIIFFGFVTDILLISHHSLHSHSLFSPPRPPFRRRRYRYAYHGVVHRSSGRSSVDGGGGNCCNRIVVGVNAVSDVATGVYACIRHGSSSVRGSRAQLCIVIILCIVVSSTIPSLRPYGHHPRPSEQLLVCRLLGPLAFLLAVVVVLLPRRLW